MAELFPAFEEEDEEDAAQETPPAYLPSFIFDFASGDFVLDGAGRIPTHSGHAAWAIWCAKAILTERQTFLAYTPAYGIDLDEVRDATDRTTAEAELEHAITEALMSDPRTEGVREFSFAWEGDAVTVSFTAFPAVGTPERIVVTLTP